jgi:glycerol-3-phosphate dehydrogenase (NAD(P)+)
VKCGVIGGGSWGSAFALHLARLRVETRFWVREKKILDRLRRTRENTVFLPGHVFPSSVTFCQNIREVAETAEVLFIAVPSQFCRRIFKKIAPVLSREQVVVSLTKGIEEGSLKRMTEVMGETFPPRSRPHLAVLSGPSFAREVADRHPTAVVIASRELSFAESVQRLVSNVYFRAYTSQDVIGVELGGALKNVIALATGISDALRFGHNPRAALITRGMAEITRLGTKLGAARETFQGLAGIGDLVLTCTAKLSRNYHVGYELGRGRPLSLILAQTKMVAEGVFTTVSVRDLAAREHVEMPITQEVYYVLYKNKDPKESLRDLMLRKLGLEQRE